MSKGSDMLLEAAKTVEERGKVYGNAKTNMGTTSMLWSAILGRHVSAEQVAMCMIAVKLARLIETPDHKDSALDIAGYAAVLRECQE